MVWLWLERAVTDGENWTKIENEEERKRERERERERGERIACVSHGLL